MVKFQQSGEDDSSKKDNKQWKKEQRLKIQMRKEGKALTAALGRKKGTWKAVDAGEE